MEPKDLVNSTKRAKHESQQEPQQDDRSIPAQQSTSNSETSDDFLLLEDMNRANRLPIPLQNLLQNLIQRNVKRPAELLIAIVYYLILETGFVPSSFQNDQSSNIRTHWGFSFVAQIPARCWKIVADQIKQQFNQIQEAEKVENITTAPKVEEIYTFRLKLLNLSDDESQLVIRKIFDGNTLCVTLCFDQQEQSTSVILPVNEFLSLPENSDFEQICRNPDQFFQKAEHLSAQIKRNLVSPIRNHTMYESAYPNAALNGLPQEMLFLLFRYFRSDLSTLQKISQACVYLRNMAITFLSESNIRLKHRQPTPITYNASDELQPRSRFRIHTGYPWPWVRNFRPFEF